MGKSAKTKMADTAARPMTRPAVQTGDGAVVPLHALSRVGDTLTNLVTGLGTSKDKATATQFAFSMLDRSQAEAAYRGDWMSRKVIDIPAYDATREWRTWQGDKKDITALTDLEKKLGLQRKSMAVLQRARLYGGAALIMGVDQGKPEEELIIDKLGKDCLKFVHVVNRYELTAGEIEWDILSPWFGQPKYYERQVQGKPNIRLHPSRVCRFLGAEIPDINQSQGWGDSVLQIVADAVIATGTVFQSMTSLVQEAKVDIVKIPELSERISAAEYENRLKTRFAMAGVMKSIYSVLLIDKEEEWDRVEQTFTGMPEVMQEFLLMVCGAADIPATRFLGQAPKGLNATGDSDTRNYYDRVSTGQKIEIQPTIDPLDQIVMIHCFGKVPDGMDYMWNPLWQMTEAEKAEIAVKQANVMTADVNAALMDPMVLQKARENQLIESGFYPGLEQIIDEFGTDINEREAAVPGNDVPMIDPETGKAPDPNDPAAMARAIPDPNAQALDPNATGNVVPFGKAPPKKPVPKAAAAGDQAIADMATRIRDASLDASTPRTLYIRRDVLNWREIAAFYKKQGVENVYGDEMHVTICYSKKPVDWLKVGTDNWGEDEKGNLLVKPGGPRVMEQFGKYLVLAFANSDLQYRHCCILDRTDGTWEYDDYTPHVSVSKDPGAVNPLTMQSWTGPIQLGPEIFEEVKVDGALYEGAAAPMAYTPDALPDMLEQLKTAVTDAIKAVPAPVVNVTVPKPGPVQEDLIFDTTGRKVIGKRITPITNED